MNIPFHKQNARTWQTTQRFNLLPSITEFICNNHRFNTLSCLNLTRFVQIIKMRFMHSTEVKFDQILVEAIKYKLNSRSLCCI
jgi:hypothetical protein